MPHLQFTTLVQCDIERAFALIADLPNYSAWLPSSGLYQSVMHISDIPIKQGTTYVDQGTTAPMHGTVEVYQPPNRLTFHQNENMRIFALISGKLDVEIRYVLASRDKLTAINRDAIVTLDGTLRLLQPVIISRIRAENERILACMKAHLEK